ncbi:dihydroneopterin aldolase [Candidatus Saccharibacteria bacterium]|nr:dihydroneopterin aldolase [Candidatus Saccharibacteria bacterium]NIV72465.1 dihydroneopterin aldolase [Calditrichia bacterium]NIW78745.1 dihydroneopterin aldolase [Calditrichia bacterium]
MEMIRLNNMIFYAHHGYYPAERELGQKFEIDVEMECDLSRAVKSDSLKDTVNYHKVYDKVSEIFNNYKFILIEKLADKIAYDILDNFLIHSIRIRIRKPQVSMHGFLDNVEVEIYRERSK